MRGGIVLLAAVLALHATTPARSPAQQPPTPSDGWNGPRVMGLVERARDRRQEPLADTTLRNYRAQATGHIYFFLDREDAGEPVLLRADQVALDLYWGQPGRSKQVIRGMRSEEQFPIKNFAYYLDRYTVIQNGFGDEIRVGEGRDVADVPHPLSADGAVTYDFRLADSTTIRLPGRAEPLRVYEVQVRPKDFGEAAIVGTLYLERARADLVRLAFTFTPAAYLDPRNERVEVVLENALWDGRYWLPREQRLLVRREIPELDLDVGTVIRAVVRVTDIELNTDLPPTFFAGAPVLFAVGPKSLATYDFDEGLYDGLDDVGLTAGAAPGTLDAVDVDAIAGRILRERFLRGVPRLRFWAPDVSSIVRYDRAEGLVTGAGLAFGIGESQFAAYAARAWGAEQWSAEIGWLPLGASRDRWEIQAYYLRPADLGLRPGAAGVVSSLATAFIGEDYRDLYYASGTSVARTFEGGFLDGLTLRATGERHESAEQRVTTSPVGDEPLRPVYLIRPGDLYSLTLSGQLGSVVPGIRAGATFAFEVGAFDDGTNIEPFSTATLQRTHGWRGDAMEWGVDTRLTARLTANAPVQRGVLLGGRNTLPGHRYRAFHGENAAVADLEAWRTVVPRWIRLRGLLAAGFVAARDEPGTDLIGDVDYLFSAGIGLGFIDGLLRLDLAWGWPRPATALTPDAGDPDPWFEPAGGVLYLSLDPRLWDFL